jgi:hypothetical protein
VAARKSSAEGETSGDELIAKRFAPLRRHPCWGVSYDRQLNLTMSFGAPSLRIREPYVTHSKSPVARRMASRRSVTVRGQWWLWLFCCYWQLKRNDEVLATGSASFRRIERALKELNGQKLSSLSVDWKTGSTRFAFDLGCELSCRRFERDSNSDLWTLYGPGDDCLSVNGAGQCREDPVTAEERGKRVRTRRRKPDHRP